ncbi:OmpA family protein, partial [Hymenobacter sp. AT01-02]|uniref:OmpA family protein n=1 Tax=Hymenobacter sp. AT01-02 TaxID=1571877 RepID=UPI00128F4068
SRARAAAPGATAHPARYSPLGYCAPQPSSPSGAHAGSTANRVVPPGKADLLPESRPALNQLATELMARPTLKLRIAGHTDRVGEPEKNQVLSEQRAEAVKAYLVKAGIAAERISTIGYGDSRPLYPSPDVRNRRVEVSQAAE